MNNINIYIIYSDHYCCSFYTNNQWPQLPTCNETDHWTAISPAVPCHQNTVTQVSSRDNISYICVTPAMYIILQKSHPKFLLHIIYLNYALSQFDCLITITYTVKTSVMLSQKVASYLQLK